MREEARKATIMSYRHRCTAHVALKGQPKMFSKPNINYQGDFDYQAVADGVSLPRNCELGNHQVAWNVLYRAFDKAWQEYAIDQRTKMAEVF